MARQYAILMYEDETTWDRLCDAERHKRVRAHIAFADAVEKHATMLGGDALVETTAATTLRHDAEGRSVLTDGPFAETVEHLGGLYVVEAADLDVMVSLCEELPHGYAVEIRPIRDMAPVYDLLPDESAQHPGPGGSDDG